MTDRPPGPTDRELVAAHLSGDPAAFATIYDRYADPLHDTAAAMLSDRHDAEDMTHDVFVIAAGQLGRLRDPDRLRPWLFSILRHEVYRRSKRRSRVRATDLSESAVDMSAPPDPHADAADVERAELATFVREAAAGLGERDQLLLELSARQGLAGADLADAVGVTQQQCHVLVHRMRDRVQRSIGALTVARRGRSDCPDLQALLRDWDGTFDPRVRKRVAGHIDDCDICEGTSRKFAVIPLMSAAPVLAAPRDLRTRVLESTTGSVATDGTVATVAGGGDYAFGADGFPTSAGHVPAAAVIAVAATVVLLLVGGVWLALTGGGSDGELEAGGNSSAPVAAPIAATSSTTTEPIAVVTTEESTTTTSSTTSTTTSSTTSTTTVAPATTAAPAVTTAPPPPPTPGTLVASADTIDLGSTATQATLSLANTGDEPLSWSIDGEPAPFMWSSTSGSLAPGATVDVLVAIDRDPLAESSPTRVFTVTSSAAGTAPLTVLAAVEHPPIVTFGTAPTSLQCPSPAGVVIVDVADESPISGVTLEWSGPGAFGAAPMTQRGTTWAGELAPEAVDGGWTWTAVATDARGNIGTTSAPFVVSGC